MHEVMIALRTTAPGLVVVETSLSIPRPGRKLMHSEALALDMLSTAKRQGNHQATHYEQALLENDGQAALTLARQLLDPDTFGWAVSPEVRNAARRVLGIKGQMEGLAA